jgi:hypothetical protein
MTQDILGKLRRGVKKPPKVILRHVASGLRAEVDRFVAPFHARRLTQDSLLRELEASSVGEIWSRLALRPYYSRPVNPAEIERYCPEATKRIVTAAGPDILVSRFQPVTDGKPVAVVQRISRKQLLDGANSELNLSLEGGEEIRVPEAGKIYVVGNVKHPGVFPIQDSAESSVMKALAFSEGLLSYTSSVAYIYRREDVTGKKNEIPIELKKIIERKAPDVPLLPNDVLYVPDRPGRRLTMTALEKVVLFGSGITAAAVYAGTR